MSVEVKLELGHKAILRSHPTPEGFTHDWTVFVKGCEGSNIFHFVDKVVFYLHESFPKPKRVVKESPYQVSECGYAGFIMPIEVYFRSKEEPKKVRFEYDLYLRLEGEPVHNIRLEKLTFQNPSEDFRRKLLKARSDRCLSSSAGIGLPTLAVAPLQHSEDPRPPVVHSKPTPAIPEKKPPRAHSAAKESSHSNHPKQSKQQSAASNSVIIARKEPKSTKESHSNEVKDTKTKSTKLEKESKSNVKRSHQSSDVGQSSAFEKKRKYSSSSSGKSSDGAKIEEEKKKDRHKSKANATNKKEKQKTLVASQHKNSKSPKVSRHKVPQLDVIVHSTDSDDAKNSSSFGAENVSDPSSADTSGTPDEPYSAMSPIHGEIDNDFISPLSSDDESPVHSKEKSNHSMDSDHSFQSEPMSKPDSYRQKGMKKTPTKKHNNGKQNVACKENIPSSAEDEPPFILDSNYHEELVELQKRIMTLSDREQLQNIVDVIEQTGKYHVSSSSFDFDLYKLDQNTVRLIKGCLSM